MKKGINEKNLYVSSLFIISFSIFSIYFAGVSVLFLCLSLFVANFIKYKLSDLET